MIINSNNSLDVVSATPREDDTGSLETIGINLPNYISFVESDGFEKLASSRPIPTVWTVAQDCPKKSDNILLQLTDQTNLLPFRQHIFVFAGLALCCITCAFDYAIVATTMPTISESFNAGSIVSWVSTAYLLASTIFQPLYGRLSDIFGRKLALCVAMTVYVLGSLAAGFSRSIIQLIIFRGIAGAGGGGIQSTTQIIVSDIVSLRDRGKYQGTISMTMGVGYALGPLVGGALVQSVSWRWCFWIFLPVATFSVCIVFFLLPLKPVQGNIKEKLMAVDYLGTMLIIFGSILILLPLNWGGVRFPWNSAIIVSTMCLGVPVVFLFCLWEWKYARFPIIPMYIFKRVTIIGVYIAMFINGFLFFSSLYCLPQFFQIALGYTPIQSGVFLLPVLVSQSFANWTTGLIVSRTGKYRTSIYVGFVAWAVGCGCLSTVRASTSKVYLVVYMLLSGMGAGQTLPTTIVAAQASVLPQDMSVVTAVRNFARLLGGAFAQAVGFAVINNSLRSDLSSSSLSPSMITAIIDKPEILDPHTPTSTPTQLGLTPAVTSYILSHGYTAGFQRVFILNACLAAIAAIVSFLMIQHNESTRSDNERLKAEALDALRDGGKSERGTGEV